jgi:uncharacterized protein YkwD
MPLKQPSRKLHHHSHGREKRSKRFLKVYAPYIPLLLIVGIGLALSGNHEYKQSFSDVKSYATDMSDDGLLEETNKMRLQEGLPPLKLDPLLDSAAQSKAFDMGNRNYWSHDTPDGKKPWTFIENAGYTYSKAAENLAYGFDSSKTTISGWMNSPGHKANIMDPELKEVGFGILNAPAYQNHGSETIVVAMYGKPSSAAQPTSSSPVAASLTPLNSAPKNVSFLQTLTQGKAPWSNLVSGIIMGALVTYLLLKHARHLRKAIRRSENFVVHHPVLDMTLVALAVLIALIGRSVGTIY